MLLDSALFLFQFSNRLCLGLEIGVSYF